MALGDSINAMRELPVANNYGDVYLGNSSSPRTMLCEFMEAYAVCNKIIYEFAKMMVLGRSGYDQRVAFVTDLLGCYATMKRCLGEYPYINKRNHNKVPQYSNFVAVNVLLEHSIIDMGVLSSEAMLNDFLKAQKEEMSVIRPVAQSVCDVMGIFVNSIIGKNKDQDTLYVVKYAMDAAVSGKNLPFDREQRTLKSFGILRVLSYFGYGDATFELGVGMETDKYADLGLMQGKDIRQERLKAAFEYYQKASEQGNVKAKIRLGNCYAFGIGCQKEPNQAYQLLKPLTGQKDFDKYGAYAYMYLIDEIFPDKREAPLVMLEGYTAAACHALKISEREAAQKRLDEYYDKYYK